MDLFNDDFNTSEPEKPEQLPLLPQPAPKPLNSTHYYTVVLEFYVQTFQVEMSFN